MTYILCILSHNTYINLYLHFRNQLFCKKILFCLFLIYLHIFETPCDKSIKYVYILEFKRIMKLCICTKSRFANGTNF